MLPYIQKKCDQIKRIFLELAEKPAKVYLLVAVPVVLLFAFITPPFQGPDEEAHFVRAQYIAHGYLVPVSADTTSGLPASIEDVAKKVFYENDIRGKTSTTYDIFRIKQALQIQLAPHDTYKPVMISYSPVSYLPAIPGIVLSNLLNLNPLVSLYLARILLGLASITLFFVAIRLLPTKKYLMMAVGLIPMVLFQQSVVTADSLSYALLALFVAYILYLKSKSEITVKQWTIVGLIALTITLAKPLVFLFLPLIFILIHKKKALRKIFIIGSICVAVLALWMAVSSSKADIGSTEGLPDNVNSSKQIEVLLNEPKRAARVMWNSYMTPYGDDETRGLIGVFGAADTVYPLWMYTLYAALLILLAVTTFSKTTAPNITAARWRWLAIILSILYFTLVNFVIYLGYSPVNFDIFYGVQGRYFIPILIVLAAFVFTGGIRIVKKDQVKAKVWIISSIVLLLLLALFITYQRYYLYTP